MRNVGIVLAELAADRGMTRSDVSRAAGISNTTTGQLFNGKVESPHFHVVYQIACALGVGLDDVMFLASADHGPLEKPAAAADAVAARRAVELFLRNPTSKSYVAACKAMMSVIPE